MPYLDISVCIATYKRPRLLDRLLRSLAIQELQELSICYEIVVVDNDAEKSAKPTFKRFSEAHPHLLLTYDVEDQKSISRARNKAVSLAKGEFVAFIDDDEWADKLWLKSLFDCIMRYKADAVFGPVLQELPEQCPGWLRKCAFFDRPAIQDGKLLPIGRTNNALVRSEWLKLKPYPFKLRYGLTGGEDFDFFRRIRARGAMLCSSQYAKVHEYVEPYKTRLSWLLARSFRGGQVYSEATVSVMGSTQKWFHYTWRGCLSATAFLIAVATLPIGIHRSVWWLKKACSYAGQVSILLPFRYSEYDR